MRTAPGGGGNRLEAMSSGQSGGKGGGKSSAGARDMRVKVKKAGNKVGAGAVSVLIRGRGAKIGAYKHGGKSSSVRFG